jgi:chromosomal replication initiation ATPase DnaA
MHMQACTSPETRTRSAEPDGLALVEQLVMRTFGLELPTLRADRRGRAPIAFARQVAIYISHVHLRMTLTEVARYFRRDRTTAGHACRRVEDRREDPDVDRRIEAVEVALTHYVGLWRSMRGGEAEVQQ